MAAVALVSGASIYPSVLCANLESHGLIPEERHGVDQIVCLCAAQKQSSLSCRGLATSWSRSCQTPAWSTPRYDDSGRDQLTEGSNESIGALDLLSDFLIGHVAHPPRQLFASWPGAQGPRHRSLVRSPVARTIIRLCAPVSGWIGKRKLRRLDTHRRAAPVLDFFSYSTWVPKAECSSHS